MTSSSLRALLLALAMVLQTIAGGAGVARAAPGETGAGFLAHCDSPQQTDEAAGGRPGDHRHCESCCLCAAGSAGPIPDIGSVLIAHRDEHRIVSFTPHRTRELHAAYAQSPPARGPPAGVAAAR
jgi:hypothetical protein